MARKGRSGRRLPQRLPLHDRGPAVCRDGHEVHHLLGVSCFAERAVVSEKSVVKITEGVPSEIAAITGCAVITGVGAVLNVVGECAGRAAVGP